MICPNKSYAFLTFGFGFDGDTERDRSQFLMRTIQLPQLQFVRRAVLVLGCLMIAGCSAPKTKYSETASSTSPLTPESWKPSLIYLLEDPYPSLYVEVDAVVGCEPKDETLQALREFLTKYCNKPGGIKIAQSDTIPVENAREISEQALARLYIDGPNKDSDPESAFLYILFYDSTLSPLSDACNLLPHSKKKKSYATSNFYPAIYFNIRSATGYFRSKMSKYLLLHEAGHILGLVNKPSPIGHHCTDKTCLMYPTLYTERLLLGQQKKLCYQCEVDLTTDSKLPPLTAISFNGAVGVRAETNYYVLSLPGRLRIGSGRFTEDDYQTFATEIGKEADPKSNFRAVIKLSEAHEKDPIRLREFFDSIKTDQLYDVRVVATNAAPYYAARLAYNFGQYSEAVDGLYKTINDDPTVVSSLNLLAWIKATCPDATIRRGHEAIALAKRACDITRWKRPEHIDTLAASYAETGDFKNAVKFQEQALAIRELTNPTDGEMEERLSLYKQSKPFREMPKPSARLD